ncbi:MAG: NusG domain II-containing protein [Bacteroidota bacterium]|nr:NusG domain II-containing protein [Bacteroidota bacterium]
MDRREFFKLGFRQVKDSARKSAPEMIRRKMSPTLLDVSILTENPDKAETLANELLAEHFGERFLRLRQSSLTGTFPGGIVLFEGSSRRDFHDGASLFYAALTEMEQQLRLAELQSDPILLRYVNRIPAFSRTAEVYRNNRLVQAIPLYEDARFTLEGHEGGSMEVEVRDKRLAVLASSCAHGTCCAHPPVITPGQRITCIPNRVTIAIGLQE